MEKEIKNAKITNASITMEDHGCITFWLTLEGDGWGCGYGGYCLGHGCIGYKPKEFTASDKGLVAMMRVMDTVGVYKWEDLKGKYIRCKVGGPGDTIDEIGNIVEDKWFNIRKFFEFDRDL